MKVVLFCGGLGMRLREHSETIPKPMVLIGYRPILWHIMKYYAHYGHKEFILCLGYKADVIKNYFLHYEETLSNDFVYADTGNSIRLLNSDISDWKITFVDTGLNANIGQRLMAVRPYLEGELEFAANYTDVLTDLPLPALYETFTQSAKAACFIAVNPTQSFHMVSIGEGGLVNTIQHVAHAGLRINGGYFFFKSSVFDHIRDGEELVQEPFQRLIAKGELIAHRHDGFWACMDTFKERQMLEDLYTRGQTPWEVWKHGSAPHRSAAPRILTAELSR